MTSKVKAPWRKVRCLGILARLGQCAHVLSLVDTRYFAIDTPIVHQSRDPGNLMIEQRY
jgi:hypothetical protein